MNRSAFWMIKYTNGSVFSKARYMNGVGFEILARSPVPKLPLSYPRRVFAQKIGFDISCICMKCQCLFSAEKNKTKINLSSAEFARIVVKVNYNTIFIIKQLLSNGQLVTNENLLLL